MKNNCAIILLTAAGLLLNAACTPDQQPPSDASLPCDKDATAETILLRATLETRQNDGIMIGHQDALAYGNNWLLDKDRSDMKSVCGDHPAVFGWNISNVENGASRNSDSVPFATIASYVQKVEQWGGLSVFIWPAGNPATGGNAHDCSVPNVAKQIVENDDVRQKYLASLDKVAAFFGQLSNENGQPIAIVFQPFHGHNARQACWWHPSQCPAKDFKKLWELTVDHLRHEKGLHHILYAYSAYSGTDASAYCPENDYVDIVGLNAHWLQSDNQDGADFVRNLNKDIGAVCRLAEENGKIAAITSTGMEGIKASNFFSGYLYPVISQYKLSFVLFEKNAWNQEQHYFIPVPGHPAGEDFVRFVDYPNILTCKDMKTSHSKP